MLIYRKLAGARRVKAVRKSIEPGLGRKLKERNEYLKDLFISKSIEMKEKIEFGENTTSEDGCSQYVNKVGVSININLFHI